MSWRCSESYLEILMMLSSDVNQRVLMFLNARNALEKSRMQTYQNIVVGLLAYIILTDHLSVGSAVAMSLISVVCLPLAFFFGRRTKKMIVETEKQFDQLFNSVPNDS
jgi:hypothetical protein